MAMLRAMTASLPSLLLLLACARDGSLEVELSPAVETVAIARWSTDQAELGRVRWGRDGAWEGELEEEGASEGDGASEGSTTHELVVAGLYPDQVYDFQVRADGDWSRRSVRLETGSPPARLAQLDAEGDPGAFHGYLPLAMIGVSPGIQVVDATGEVVWYAALSDPTHQARRVWYLPRDRRFLVNAQDGDEVGHLFEIPLDGSEQREIPVEEHHHDFLVLPDGDLLLLGRDERELDGAMVRGDRLIRQAPDGSRQTVWSTWDALDPTLLPIDEEGDWTHANAIDHYPERGLVLVSLRNMDGILALDDQTFELQWALGGPLGTLSLDEASAFKRQHQFELLDDNRLVVFDNHSVATDDGGARVVAFQLDMEAGTATELWRYHHDPSLRVEALGNVDWLSTGSTLITWSTAGEVQVVDPEGVVEWQLNTQVGAGLGFGDRFDRF